MILNPDYDPNVWKPGYQARQHGVATASVLGGLATPPAAMVTAATQAMENPPTYVTAPAPIAGTGGAEQLPK